VSLASGVPAAWLVGWRRGYVMTGAYDWDDGHTDHCCTSGGGWVWACLLHQTSPIPVDRFIAGDQGATLVWTVGGCEYCHGTRRCWLVRASGVGYSWVGMRPRLMMGGTWATLLRCTPSVTATDTRDGVKASATCRGYKGVQEG
jgi:hypothetical protein